MESKRQELKDRKHSDYSKEQRFKYIFKRYIIWIPIWVILIIMLLVVLTGGIKI